MTDRVYIAKYNEREDQSRIFFIAYKGWLSLIMPSDYTYMRSGKSLEDMAAHYEEEARKEDPEGNNPTETYKYWSTQDNNEVHSFDNMYEALKFIKFTFCLTGHLEE